MLGIATLIAPRPEFLRFRRIPPLPVPSIPPLPEDCWAGSALRSSNSSRLRAVAQLAPASQLVTPEGNSSNPAADRHG